MNKLKFVGLTFLFIFSTSGFAQEKSEIVMKKSELESFIKAIAEARRAQINAREEAKAKKDLVESRYQYNNRIGSVEYGNREISNAEILTEINRLNARLDDGTVGNSIMLSSTKDRDSKDNILQKINQLNARLDDMSSNNSIMLSSTENTSTNDKVLQEINRLNARLDDMASGNSIMLSSADGTSPAIMASKSVAPINYSTYNQGQRHITPQPSTRTFTPSYNNQQEIARDKAIEALDRRLNSLNSAQVSSQPIIPIIPKIGVQERTNNKDNQEIVDLQNRLGLLEQPLSERDSIHENVEITDLKNQLQSLEQKLATNQSNQKSQNEQKNQKIADLTDEYHSLEQKIADAKSSTERKILLQELLANFKNFKKQIFFANNSAKLSPSDSTYTQEITQVLRQYPEFSVILEGFASSKGKLNYNKQLSMRRSESVQEVLLKNGVSAERIISSFRGVDSTTSEEMARRVDISIILK